MRRRPPIISTGCNRRRGRDRRRDAGGRIRIERGGRADDRRGFFAVQGRIFAACGAPRDGAAQLCSWTRLRARQAEALLKTFAMTANTGYFLEMAIPDYQSLMLPVLSASLNGERRVGEVVESLAEELGLTPEERAQLLPSGGQTLFANRVHWAKTYLGKAGLIEGTRRGYFKITPRGQQVIAAKPARIDNNFLLPVRRI